MGDVKRYLHRATLKAKEPAHYAGKATYELAESMHLHRRNLRLEMSADEFRAHVKMTRRAGENWYEEAPSPGRATRYLQVEDLRPEPDVSPDRFEVEECEYETIPEGTVHVHYRDLRLEFSPEEWEEFADGIAAARKVWGRTREK